MLTFSFRASLLLNSCMLTWKCCCLLTLGGKADVSRPPPCLHDQHGHDAVNGETQRHLMVETSLPSSLCFICDPPSGWCHLCHSVWCDSLPDLHPSCSLYELQSDHTEPRTADSQNHCSHHQPGGHPHTGRGVRSCGTVAHGAG